MSFNLFNICLFDISLFWIIEIILHVVAEIAHTGLRKIGIVTLDGTLLQTHLPVGIVDLTACIRMHQFVIVGGEILVKENEFFVRLQ